jgi:hypothetical protein
MDMNIPYTVEERPDSGLANGKLGIWLFLASEVMLFGALFSTYIILRMGAPEWPHGELNVPLGTVNTIILIGSSMTMVMAWASLKLHDWSKHRLYLILTVVLALVFLVNKYFEYAAHVSGHLLHADRPARPPHPGRDHRDALFPRTGREAVQAEPRPVHEPHRVHRAVLALRRPGLDFPVPGAVSVVGPALRRSSGPP